MHKNCFSSRFTYSRKITPLCSNLLGYVVLRGSLCKSARKNLSIEKSYSDEYVGLFSTKKRDIEKWAYV